MNYYDFSGGIVSRKSPYLMKTNEMLDLCNFEIEGGGLTVRSGTKQLYGPFLGEVKAIHRALSEKGHEILYVQTEKNIEMVVAGVKCNASTYGPNFHVVHLTDGYLYLMGSLPRRMGSLYRRVDGEVSIPSGKRIYMILEQLEDDYTTDGDFPADLYGANLVNSRTGELYYVSGHTQATKENIYSLLNTSAFTRLGKIGDLAEVSHTAGDSETFYTKTLTSYFGLAMIRVLNTLYDMMEEVHQTDVLTSTAFGCPYIVWHPASMRYFAAGNPESPTTLYISEPNDILSFSESNLLYPHLHLGKITGLNIVEKSVVVTYEYGWSHYVGSDPTVDAQWSLLSIPDGTKYGQTVALTPGSVSFLSEGGLMSFSSSMLTVQMLYSPSSSLYKFLSQDKLQLPKPEKSAFGYYKNGKYYLAIDSEMYVYHFHLGAFLRYEGIHCQCIAEDYEGRLLMGSGSYITTFSPDCSYDFDPDTKAEIPISYRVTAPVLGAVNENEIARCEEVVVKSMGMPKSVDCMVKLSSERESGEGKLLHTNHLLFGNSTWNHRYRDSEFSETVFPWRVSGNLFLLEIQGTTDPTLTSPLKILNIYLQLKKERNKLC